jgi:hypothetical protein
VNNSSQEAAYEACSIALQDIANRFVGTVPRDCGEGDAGQVWFDDWRERHCLCEPLIAGDGAVFKWPDIFVRRSGFVFHFHKFRYPANWTLYLIQPRNGKVLIEYHRFEDGGSELRLHPQKPSLFSFSPPAEIRRGGYSSGANDPGAPWWTQVEAELPALSEAGRELTARWLAVEEQVKRDQEESLEQRRREDRDWYR